MAVDPSLTCSGWALFSLQDSTVLACGKVKSLGPEYPMAQRLSDLQLRILELLSHFNLSKGDVLICEGETTMRDPRAAFKVEQVRCIFETLARSRSLEVPGRLNPRTIQNEVLALRGRQAGRTVVKQIALKTAFAMFERDFARLGLARSEAELKTHQDIIDALLLGSVATGRIQMAARAGQTLTELFGAKPRRRGARRGWGKGGDNSFGWTDKELKKVVGIES